jgi:hypothetical protein
MGTRIDEERDIVYFLKDKQGRVIQFDGAAGDLTGVLRGQVEPLQPGHKAAFEVALHDKKGGYVEVHTVHSGDIRVYASCTPRILLKQSDVDNGARDVEPSFNVETFFRGDEEYAGLANMVQYNLARAQEKENAGHGQRRR